jgi:hypothetical protein
MSVAQEVYNVTTVTTAESVSQVISGCAPGCILVVSCCINGGAAPFSTPTDTAGLTWNALASETNSSPNRAMAQWWAKFPAGGSTTVTAHWTANTSNYGLFVTELDGVVVADGYSGNDQSSVAGANAIVSGDATNAQAPALMYSICWCNISNTANLVAGNGTQISNVAGSSGQLGGTFTSQWKSITALGSQQATFTDNGADAPALTLMAMFDLAAVVGPWLPGMIVGPGLTPANWEFAFSPLRLGNYIPHFAGAADVVSQWNAVLTTAIELAGAASALSSAGGSLSTQIDLAGAASDLSSATGQLLTAIELVANSFDAATVSGTMGDDTSLAGAAQDVSSAAGALLTQIKLLGAAVDVVSAAGALATQIVLQANALSATTVMAAITTGIKFGGAAVSLTTAAGPLSTEILLGAAARDVVTAAGALTTQIRFAAAAMSASEASGALTTSDPIAGAATTLSTATGQLTTLIKLASQALSQAVGAAGLQTQIELGGAAQVETAVDPALLTDPAWGGPVATVRAPIDGASFRDGPLPFGAFFQRAGSHLVYAIDWTGWLENHWTGDTAMTAGTSVVRPLPENGYQYSCIASGYSGSAEPDWPTTIGAQVQDGSATWQCAPIDPTSLQAQLIQATWEAPSGVMATASLLSGQMTLVMLDTRYATPGTDYDCCVTVITTTGEQAVGKIRLKVR